MGETMSYTRLTSFLQKDTSFLSPWSWDPKASENEASTLRNEKQYLRFQPGSYFAVSVTFLFRSHISFRQCNQIGQSSLSVLQKNKNSSNILRGNMFFFLIKH